MNALFIKDAHQSLWWPPPFTDKGREGEGQNQHLTGSPLHARGPPDASQALFAVTFWGSDKNWSKDNLVKQTGSVSWPQSEYQVAQKEYLQSGFGDFLRLQEVVS